jgi:hypothetical protein
MSTLSVTNLKNAASATNNLVLNPDGSVNISGGTLSPQTGFKNRIINGAMTIDQRNAGAAVTPVTTQYFIDRFFAQLNVTSKFSTQQLTATPPVGFSRYLRVTSLSAHSLAAGDVATIVQPIEGFNVADLGWGTANAATVTVSFRVRSSLTGNFGGTIQNDGQARSYPFTYTISAANTWEEKTVTIPGDTSGTWLTNNGLGIQIKFSMGTGSTFSGTAGAWSSSLFLQPTGSTSIISTNGATWDVTGIQLEKGSTATPFEFRSIGTELGLCCRYFQAMKPTLAISAEGSTNSLLVSAVSYPVQMRATPTVSQSGVFAYELPFGNKSTQSTVSITIDAPTTNNVGAAFNLSNFSSLVFSRTYRPEANTNALLFSAEL